MIHELEPRCFHLRSYMPIFTADGTRTICGRIVDYQRAVSHPDNVCCPDCVAKIHEPCSPTHCEVALDDCPKREKAAAARAAGACNHEECRGLAACQRTDDGSLTFAEAMALDPSEVEVTISHVAWSRLDNGEWKVSDLRRGTYRRRSRPKRSRVQEMAAEKWKPVSGCSFPDEQRVDEQAREEAIRAVCEWMKEGGKVPLATAAAIELHFLEPR